MPSMHEDSYFTYIMASLAPRDFKREIGRASPQGEQLRAGELCSVADRGGLRPFAISGQCYGD